MSDGMNTVTFASAVAQMEQVERDLVAQLAAVRGALVALGAPVSAPVVSAPAKVERRAKAPRPSVTVAGAVNEQAIRFLLKAGPKSPSQIESHFRVSRYELRKTLDPLIASGALVASGSTTNRSVSLPGSQHAAKEAP